MVKMDLIYQISIINNWSGSDNESSAFESSKKFWIWVWIRIDLDPQR